VVNRVVATMDAISGSSDKIVGIVGVIEGIAFQTNILALKRPWKPRGQASRVGVRGRCKRGAQPRATLASAAKEIKELIGTSTLSVKDGSQLVAHAGATMVEVVEAVRRSARSWRRSAWLRASRRPASNRST